MSESRIPNSLSKSSSVASSSSTAATATGNPSQSFSSLMQKNNGPQDSKMISPIDLAQNGGRINHGVANQNTVLAQIQLAQNTMSTIQQQMSDPNLKLKSSQKYLIKNKLSSANTSLQSAHAKLDKALLEQDGDAAGRPSNGLTSTNPHEDTSDSPKGPVSTFFSYVTSGLNEMDAVKNLVADITKKGANLNPGDFLLIQIKLAKAQQELEFTSGLLSKVVEDFKMIMNIQL